MIQFGVQTLFDACPISEMTYTVSSGMLNCTIPYHLMHDHWLCTRSVL